MLQVIQTLELSSFDFLSPSIFYLSCHKGLFLGSWQTNHDFSDLVITLLSANTKRRNRPDLEVESDVQY